MHNGSNIHYIHKFNIVHTEMTKWMTMTLSMPDLILPFSLRAKYIFHEKMHNKNFNVEKLMKS